MKVFFFGQATGGNALLWFNFLNNKSKNNQNLDITFLARTLCTLKCSFKVFSPYGYKKLPKIIQKLRNKAASLFLLDLYLAFLRRKGIQDLLILQGNYTPTSNMKVLMKIPYKTSILNIYGSDFYRKYLRKELNNNELKQFVQVLDKVDVIHCNWHTTKCDFLNEFPQFSDKVICCPWGADLDWYKYSMKPRSENDKKVFLSTRALHSYNNVELVVEAFCRAFPNDTNHRLHVVGAYGCDPKVLNKIHTLITEYNHSKNIKIEIDKWYEGRDLMNLYDSADYNVCFGSTDQLTISIVYAFLRGIKNILSPLDNYHYLNQLGFKTQLICKDISVESLKNTFLYLVDNSFEKSDIKNDEELARKVFNLETVFNQYVEKIDEK